MSIEKLIEAAAVTDAEFVEEGTAIRRSYLFAADFPVFQGHFPGFPLLPAVVQITVGRLLVQQLRGGEADLAVMENARFIQQIQPGQRVDAICRKSFGRGGESYAVELEVDEKRTTSYVLRFVESKD